MYTKQIIDSLSLGECPDIEFDNDEDFKPFNQYIDMLFNQGLLVKHDQYDFEGVGFANLINQSLTNYKLIPVRSSDNRLITKAKGQAVYFILTKDGNDIGSLIMTWCYDPFHLFKDF